MLSSALAFNLFPVLHLEGTVLYFHIFSFHNEIKLSVTIPVKQIQNVKL